MDKYHLAYKTIAQITGLPDPATVLYCTEDYTLYGPDLWWTGHTGIDGYKTGTDVPLYALSDGLVLFVSSPATPNGYYVSYQYAGIAPAVRTSNGLTWCIEHMQSCNLAVNQIVRKGDLIGYQGYTGYVIPEGVGGTHSHTKMFNAADNLIDPMHYITGVTNIPTYEGGKVTIPIRIPRIGFSPIRRTPKHKNR